MRHHGGTAPGRTATPRPNSDEVFERDHRAERHRRSDVRAEKEVGVSKHAVRQAERVKEADPEVFDQLGAGIVPLRGTLVDRPRRRGRTTPPASCGCTRSWWAPPMHDRAGVTPETLRSNSNGGFGEGDRRLRPLAQWHRRYLTDGQWATRLLGKCAQKFAGSTTRPLR